MDYRRFAVQGLDDNAREEFVRLQLTSFRIPPPRQDKRPTTVLGSFPVLSKPAQIESSIETHDECLGLNRHPEDFLQKLSTGVQMQLVTTISGSIGFRGSRVFAKQIEFFSAQSVLIVEDSFFRAYIFVFA